MPKRISAADRAGSRRRPAAAIPGADTPVRVVIVTLDRHLAGAAVRAQGALARELPGLSLSLHAASEWRDNPETLARCRADIAQADIIIASMLFMEEHFAPIADVLAERRDACDALVGILSAREVVRLTRLNGFTMDGSETGALAWLKRLRGKPGEDGRKGRKAGRSAGAHQMAMLRRIPQILRFIPGTAQDVRAYFLAMQYWLAGCDGNVANLVRFLVDRYADGPRRVLRGRLKPAAPRQYPDVGVYHPHLTDRIAERADRLPGRGSAARGRVGLLLMRAYVLAGQSRHYDGVIERLEARGLDVVPAFASGLDSRPAVEAFFMRDGRATVDAVVSLTGFSLVGGPAYNDAHAAEEMLAGLDVPYLAAHALEFQSLESWQASERGLLPVEATMMVAIPELDGATGPMVFGGRSAAGGAGDMQAADDRADRLAARVERLIQLRRTPRDQRRIAAILFNFPPNAGSTGTAAHLSVFASLYNTMRAMRDDGYTVELPADVEALRRAVLTGNAERFGADAHVAATIPVDDHVRREPWLAEIEAQWGPAPGRQQTDGASLFVLGRRFGNVFVGVQPAFGYEGDPMRLLFERGFTPTHAFSAFYRWLSEDFSAHAVLHFGTHGALEFMPGKQAGMTQACWPDRLIGDLPNIYLYAGNNPSEGTIAKRRAAATLVSYLTPPVTQAGLYRGLVDLKASLDRWRGLGPSEGAERERLVPLIRQQALALDLIEAPSDEDEAADAEAWAADPAWTGPAADATVQRLAADLVELEATLIPHGLHVVGEPPVAEERADLLMAVATASHGLDPARAGIEALVDGAPIDRAIGAAGLSVDAEMRERFAELRQIDGQLAAEPELPALLHALDGGFVRPAPGGDLLRTPAILPTGRNLHGFDPFRIPSAFAVADGAAQADRLLARHRAETGEFPETVAMVLWGTDNLKTEGGPIAQALALIGATPRFDSYGRLAGAQLVPLETLGRPRIDVVVTLSGICRDLLPLQTRMLAEAAWLAASAEDEPLEMNAVRRHALAYAESENCDLETASLRVFSNADGAYGSNVNQLVDSGCWEDEDELAETYTRRKCFAYGREGQPAAQAGLLKSVLGGVQLAYQNLDSVDLGVTTIDHYFDTLGGIGRAVRRARGDGVPVYIGDQTQGAGKVRTLSEQVALETRTRALNPRWYEGMLEHGYEGVRQIEAQVTNTMGWSATTGQVAPWIYQQLTQTFMLDEAMRRRLAELNPKASAKVANRLLEAHERRYWSPDEATLDALRRAGEELEDRLEGLGTEAAA